MHLEFESLFHRVRTLNAQNAQLLGLLSNAETATARPSGIRGKLAEILHPIDLLYRPDQLEPMTLGATANVTVIVTNLGAKPFGRGTLRLSYHWRRMGDPDYLVWDGVRTEVEESLEPGCPVSVSATVRFPETPGYYLLEWDAVQEGSAWMSQRGVAPYRQMVVMRSAHNVVASIDGLPVMVGCSASVDVRVRLSGGLEDGWGEADFGWRWTASDGRDESGWEAGASARRLDGEDGVVRFVVRTPRRPGSYWLEIGQHLEDAWLPLKTIGGGTYVLAQRKLDLPTGRNDGADGPEAGQVPDASSHMGEDGEEQWLPGEAEYCLARIEQLLLSRGSRLELAKLESIFVERAEGEGWLTTTHAEKFEWAMRRWLAEVAELERQLNQERRRAARFANLVDSYRTTRVARLLAFLDRLSLRGSKRREA